VRVRRCRACGEEYRPDIASCSDCGGPLEDVDDELVPFESRPRPGVAPQEAPRERKPPEGYVPVYIARDIGDVEPLAECLESAGIRLHVLQTAEQPDRSPAIYTLLVPEQDAPAARRALQPQLGEGADPEAVDRGFDPDAGYSQCPACSAEIPRGAEACPDCGLSVSPETEAED
jgi:hypothetical protein